MEQEQFMIKCISCVCVCVRTSRKERKRIVITSWPFSSRRRYDCILSYFIKCGHHQALSLLLPIMNQGYFRVLQKILRSNFTITAYIMTFSITLNECRKNWVTQFLNSTLFTLFPTRFYYITELFIHICI